MITKWAKVLMVVVPVVLIASMVSPSTAFACGDDHGVMIELRDNKDSAYRVTLSSLSDRTWTYRVREERGRDLSHWGLCVDPCVYQHLTGISPAGYEIGYDGSTGYYGIKWELNDAFKSGDFSFTLDGDFAPGRVGIVVKGGKNHRVVSYVGPTCSEPVTPVPETSTLLLTGIGALSMAGYVWMRSRRASSTGSLAA